VPASTTGAANQTLAPLKASVPAPDLVRVALAVSVPEIKRSLPFVSISAGEGPITKSRAVAKLAPSCRMASLSTTGVPSAARSASEDAKKVSE
jgi:hypothetical protein